MWKGPVYCRCYHFWGGGPGEQAEQDWKTSRSASNAPLQPASGLVLWFFSALELSMRALRSCRLQSALHVTLYHSNRNPNETTGLSKTSLRFVLETDFVSETDSQ